MSVSVNITVTVLSSVNSSPSATVILPLASTVRTDVSDDDHDAVKPSSLVPAGVSVYVSAFVSPVVISLTPDITAPIGSTLICAEHNSVSSA